MTQEQFLQLWERLGEMKATQEATLAEARKTNGRVTLLESQVGKMDVLEERITGLQEESKEKKEDAKEKQRTWYSKIVDLTTMALVSAVTSAFLFFTTQKQ